VKITKVETFLMGVGDTPRNWLFVKVHTDEGITGVGEASGWPKVIKAAIDDISPMVIGEDPMQIEKIWQLLFVGMMGHGMTGVVGSGAINGIEMALWDIKGKALNTPVWNLLGGKLRDSVRVYGHAFRYKMGVSAEDDRTGVVERALELKAMGYTAVKTGQGVDSIQAVHDVRKAVGDDMDIMVECAPPPWLQVKDAIILARALEPYNITFFEDAVAPENLKALARLQDATDVPIAVGERHSHIWGLREHIENELVDVIQPDAGRIGGISQLKKLSAMAEAHYITVAPHSGTLGPIGEFAALHVMCSIPNALALERVEFDDPRRYEVITNHIPTVDGFVPVPNEPGLGVDIIEEAIAKYPSKHNTPGPRQTEPGMHKWEPGTYFEQIYFQPRFRRQATMSPPKED
tara:strand:- start:7029 stop:8243 length:1215 start_codon:yes stop_codon:yes gene_type:complete